MPFTVRFYFRCLKTCRIRTRASAWISAIADYIHERKGFYLPQPTYKAALMAWVLSYDGLTYAEFEKFLADEIDWWVKKDALKYLRRDQYGTASYEKLLNEIIRKSGAEPARVAALKIIDDGVNVHNPYKNADEAARLLRYAAGKIRHFGLPESMVGTVLSYVLDKKLPVLDWKRFLGTRYKTAEDIAFAVKMYYESDINACIVTLDRTSFFVSI